MTEFDENVTVDSPRVDDSEPANIDPPTPQPTPEDVMFQRADNYLTQATEAIAQTGLDLARAPDVMASLSQAYSNMALVAILREFHMCHHGWRGFCKWCMAEAFNGE